MNRKDVMISAGKGEVRDGIKALVKAIPEVDRIICVGNISRHLDRVKRLKPYLLILSPSKPEEELGAWLSYLRSALTLTHVIALVENEDQRRICCKSGADVVLLKGFRGDQLIQTVREVIKAGDGKSSQTFNSNCHPEG